LCGREGSKTNQAEFVALFEGCGHGSDESANSFLCFNLFQACSCGYSANQFSFCHVTPPEKYIVNPKRLTVYQILSGTVKKKILANARFTGNQSLFTPREKVPVPGTGLRRMK
jgi:hypothetical protein